MPNRVFISYRREDSRYQALRIYDAFVHAVPPDSVFMDVDSIAPGDDFVEILEGWVQQCEVLLALIGPRWLDSIDPRTGSRRLDNPEDFVRIEIRGALARKIPVVPILLDAAGMPTAAELPDDIKALRRRNAEFVDFRTFDADVQRLIKRLKIGKKIEQPSEPPGPQAGGNGSGRTIAAVIAFVEQITAHRTAKRLLKVATAALLLVGMVYLVTGTRTYIDASARLVAYFQSEASRQTAETRASEATEALAKTEKARQEAEAKATSAAAAQARSEESRRAAETRATEAADALAKTEKARLEAEAKATAVAAAQAKSEESRRAAETRADNAADALKKSDKARQDAEAKLAALAKAEELRERAGAQASPAPLPSASTPAAGVQPSSSRKFLTDIGGKSRWAIGGTANCNTKDVNFFSLEVGNGSITWVDGFGRMNIETILASSENKFRTITYISDTTENRGLAWDYSRDGDRVHVQPLGRSAYVLTRCP
jgi:hypothetical protein